MDPEHPAPASPAPSAAPASPRVALLDRLGLRAQERPAPRFGVAIAAAGAALAVGGGIIIGGDQLGGDDFGTDPNTLPGVLISLLILGVGYALVARSTRDPLRAAGAAAAVLALPALLFFLTFDVNDVPPFSLDVILLVSTVGWAVAFLFGPSVGRPIFLGAALFGVWAFVLEQVEGLFSAPFLLFSGGGFFFGGGFSDSGFEGPDATTVGVICLVFGYAYLVVGGAFVVRKLHGLATPFIALGLFILNNGYSALAEDLEAAGTGILIAATGFAVAIYFSGFGRRGTTWIGGAGVAFGIALVIGDLMEDGDATTIGVTVLLVGAAVVAASELLSRAMSEPAEFALALPDAPGSTEPDP